MIEHLLQVIQEAGRRIMEIYDEIGDIQTKDDGSPLTRADLASHQYIVNNLPGDYPILSEENDKDTPFEERKEWTRFWCIDPLDGTKDFIQKNGEFVINIALIENGEPILGLVHVPVKQVTYVAEKGKGAWLYSGDNKQEVKIKETTEGIVKVVMSRNHCNEETMDLVGKIAALYSNKVIESVNVGSALKFLLVAEGSAHYYPRMVPTMEWDTAAPQIIVEEAGGLLVRMDTRQPLRYNKHNLRNPFIWTGIDLAPLQF